MYSKCTLCGSEWKNPKRMSAHYTSSCHRTAVRREKHRIQTLNICDHISTELRSMRRECPEMDLERVQEEMRCTWIDRNKLILRWNSCVYVHAQYMWRIVSALSLPLLCVDAVFQFLCVASAETLKRKRDTYRPPGNLNSLTYVSRGESTRRGGDTSSLVRGLNYGAVNANNLGNYAQRMDLCTQKQTLIAQEHCYFMFEKNVKAPPTSIYCV